MMSETEKAYRNLLGENNTLRTPMSRKEKLLHKMLGEDIELEPAQSREEELLLQIIDQGGGGGGGGDVTFATIKFINVDTSTMYYVNGLTGIVDIGQFEIISGIPEVDVQDESEVIVPLYKGKYAIGGGSFENTDSSIMPQVTGGVTIDFDNGMFVVTGDGTITCKGMRFS